jgi:hypothetical protein
MAVKVPYKPRRRGRIAAIAGIALLAAALAWVAATRGADDGRLESELGELKSVLDLLVIEYREALKSRDSLLESEYEVSRNLSEKALEIYRRAKAEMEEVSPADSKRLGELLEEIRRAVDSREDPAVVESLVEEATRIIDSILSLARQS